MRVAVGSMTEAEIIPEIGLPAAADKVQNADLRSDIDTFFESC
jgi:hypothetical protein